MAKIPLPERGQPLDLAYIYTLSEAINSLVTDANSLSFNDLQGKTATTKATKIVTLTVTGFTSGAHAAGDYVKFTANYSNFQNMPTATVTPIMSEPLAKSVGVSVMLYSVTATQLNGYVKFDSAVADSSTISLNVILIGTL